MTALLASSPLAALLLGSCGPNATPHSPMNNQGNYVVHPEDMEVALNRLGGLRKCDVDEVPTKTALGDYPGDRVKALRKSIIEEVIFSGSPELSDELTPLALDRLVDRQTWPIDSTQLVSTIFVSESGANDYNSACSEGGCRQGADYPDAILDFGETAVRQAIDNAREKVAPEPFLEEAPRPQKTVQTPVTPPPTTPEPAKLALPASPPPPRPQCSDGIDNDGNGRTDYPADDGCSSASDRSERPVVVVNTAPTKAEETGPCVRITNSILHAGCCRNNPGSAGCN